MLHACREKGSFDVRFLKQFQCIFYWGFHYHGTISKYERPGIYSCAAGDCFAIKRFSTLTEAFLIEFERGKDQVEWGGVERRYLSGDQPVSRNCCMLLLAVFFSGNGSGCALSQPTPLHPVAIDLMVCPWSPHSSTFNVFRQRFGNDAAGRQLDLKLGQLAFLGHSMLACGLAPSEVCKVPLVW